MANAPKRRDPISPGLYRRTFSTDDSKLEKRVGESNAEGKRHRPVATNLSWSPQTHNKEISPMNEDQRLRSPFSRVPKLSRSIRIRKWVQGKRVSQDLDDEEKEIQSKGIGSKAFVPTTNAAQKEVPLSNLHSPSGTPQLTSTLATRSKKVSRSTAMRRYMISTEPIPNESSSKTDDRNDETQDGQIGCSSLSWSNQSQCEVNILRVAALKDKLTAKGQPLTILNLLESQQYEEAVKNAREGHSRIRLDTGLLWACSQGNLTLAKEFLANGANPESRDATGMSALHLASESGSDEIVTLLINEGARVTGPSSWDNRGDYTPLMLASKYGYADIVSLLLQRGADIDAGLYSKNCTALFYAVHSGSTECVELLIKGGATINPLLLYSETPLHIAVEEGQSDIVDILLRAGADVRASRGHSKTTSLHISARGNYYHITHQLLKAGADPNQEDSNGQTALHIATNSQCFDTVQILLNYKANTNVKDSEGKTPLHTGIFKGSRNFECLRLLLENKADPNIPDNAGYTPLHLAALNDSHYCVKLFLKHGADMTLRTRGGVTALNIILRRTPEVLTHIQETLNNAINFMEYDQQLERDGQIQLDFRVLLSGSGERPECQLLSCLIEEGQKSFLKHPLCETFLFLKWLRVRSFFVFNSAFYMILVIVLTQYLYLTFTGTSEYHNILANESKHTHLARTMKSDNSNHSEEKNVSNNWLHFGFILKFESNCFEVTPHYSLVRSSLLYVLWIMLFGLTFKEGFQVIDSPRSYLSSLDNILVWPVIVGSFLITSSVQSRGTICPWEFHVAALIVLFSWLELLLLIGRFPLFGLYVHMFAQVTKNFSKFLFTYLCLINAFSLSFGILFHNQPPFQHKLFRFIKTLVMMTGEIEYNEWFYENKREGKILYEGTSHLVFAMFLLFGTIILMNLLVGLAVSDIQGLQKSAGMDRLVRQTQLISHFEAFMFSRWLKFLIPKTVLEILHSKILLLNSMYGNIFILNPKNISSTLIPSDVTDNIKRMARNQKHSLQRRRAFAEFRSLSNSMQPSGDVEGDISRGVEVIRCGLDALIWESEDHREEISLLSNKIDSMNVLLLELVKREKRELVSTGTHTEWEKDSNFLSCHSSYDNESTKSVPSSES